MARPDAPALAQLYRQHHAWLLGRLRGRMRNPSDAEDLTAETFCQVLASRVDPAILDEPRAYLTTIARRLLFHVRRRHALESAYLERLANAPEELAPSAEEQVLLLETLLAIDLALRGLPAAAKAAFLYSQLDGLGYDEIASRLGVSVRTVGRYMKQALQCCWLAGAR